MSRPITLKVISDGGSVTSRDAVSLGLIVTELVLNAVKHAFLNDKIDHRITVAYDVAGTNWQLSVADNGVGKPASDFARAKAGLGTSIVNALAQQLDARVEVSSGPAGNDRIGHSRDLCEDAAGARTTAERFAAVNSRAWLTTMSES